MKGMMFELNKVEYFTILADESKDTSNKEQVVVAIRYCFNDAINEEFVSGAEAQSLDANGLSDTIVDQLWRVDANMNNCVGQGYDGASVVSGPLNGVQQKIREKTGVEISEMAHRLNLVIVDVVNSMKSVANMIALFKQQLCRVEKMEISKVSNTWWSCQAKQFDTVWKQSTTGCDRQW